MIVVNFKNYKFGSDVLKLAKRIEKLDKKAIVAVPSVNIKEVAEKTKLKVYAQHIDSPASPEKSTGYVTAKAIEKAGAKGSLLNHSEHKLVNVQAPLGDLQERKLKGIVCVSTLREAKELKSLKPEFMAFEDPELIATGKSITQYKSGDIKKFVSLLKGSGITPLCGAGISIKKDVAEAKRLGCKGVLVASAVAKKNPEKFFK